MEEAEFRGKVLAGLESLQHQISLNRDDAQREIRELKADMMADVHAAVLDITAHVRDAGEALKREADTRWDAHTGKRGEHAQMEARRQEDIQRLYTILGLGGIVVAVVLGFIGQHVYFAGSDIAPPMGAGAILALFTGLFGGPKSLKDLLLSHPR